MNKIEKGKVWLIVIGIVLTLLSVVFLCGGIGLLAGGIKSVSAGTNAGGIIMIVFGSILSIMFFPAIVLGIRYIWIGAYLKATNGSIKEGNIAKEGGTINMKKCDKCGTEIKDGETVCSNCGKPVVEDKKE